MDIELIEVLAEAIHERYRTMDPESATCSQVARRGWHDLTGEEKEANRAQARDIENKLMAIGYEIVSCEGPVQPTQLPDEIVEALARTEHDRWMRQKVQDGCSMDRSWTQPPRSTS